MQRKQQVGECWVCVIFFACVCVGTSDMTTVSDDPSSSVVCVMCTRRFPRGVPGGAVCPPLFTRSVRGSAPKFFFGRFFSIFSGFATLKIIPVLGIRVLVSTEYLKTLYILYSEW
jgi:hypothetical protein